MGALPGASFYLGEGEQVQVVAIDVHGINAGVPMRAASTGVIGYLQPGA